MADHPTGETVEILGLNQATNGHSCPDHDNCGSVVKPDVVVTLMTRTMKTTTTTINHEAQKKKHKKKHKKTETTTTMKQQSTKQRNC